METCKTCGRPGSRPYRNRVLLGKIEEGCIDAFHNDAMALDRWHNMPRHIIFRKEIKARS